MSDSLFDIFSASQAQAPAAAPAPQPQPKQDEPVPGVTFSQPAAAAAEEPKKPVQTPPPAKTKKDKTKKEANRDHKKGASPSPASSSSSSSSGDQADARNPPGYSMLKSESNKIDRIISGLEKKKRDRIEAAAGHPVPSVCGMHNDSLLEFFGKVKEDFNKKFGNYMMLTK